eukprot:SAG11_NODE_11397_length_763_cov_1.320783_2_plen_23_part_01
MVASVAPVFELRRGWPESIRRIP